MPIYSNWSHMGGTHLVFNMFALWSFGRAVYDVRSNDTSESFK
jgi:membrane associated rhomboid family serine protease